jgi:hypothetical protein
VQFNKFFTNGLFFRYIHSFQLLVEKVKEYLQGQELHEKVLAEINRVLEGGFFFFLFLFESFSRSTVLSGMSLDL